MKRGLSQEALAEESGISNRTVQRIENGESNPTGDTLQRLSAALDVNPDELIDWTISEDNSFLVYLNLSALSFLIFPILGILIPFIMWTSKKEKIKNANELGKKLINFEISWNILLVIIPLLLYLMAQIGFIDNLNLSTILIVVFLMYFLNIALVLYNTARVSVKKQVRYFSVVRLLD